MKTEKLKGLEPENVFAYFEKICSIPHGSFHTKALSDYFVSFAEEHGLRCIQDTANNVIIFKEASAGYEDHEPVILQGHMDMVCQKEEGCTINMETDPLDVTHDGEYVFANGTSLGADNGIAVALCLAILADDTAVHPPLEVIFTSEEENGMLGATAIDLSMLKGKRMVNLDTLNEIYFTAGCAGGARVALELPLTWETYTGETLSIVLDEFHGGHSGNLIGMKYANTNKTMGQLLEKLQSLGAVRIVSFHGGTAGNAIPKNCKAVIAAEGLDVQKVEATCTEFLAELKENYEEPAATLTVTLVPAADTKIMTEETSRKLTALIHDYINGLQTWNPYFKSLPQTSLNLGVTETREDVFYLMSAVRSNVNAERLQVQAALKTVADRYGCKHTEYGIYSAWEYRNDSPLRTMMSKVYEEHYGRKPIVIVLHAGLECGVLSEKIPGLDCVSCGPTAYDLHTANERLEIASVGRSMEYIKKLLAAL